MIPNIRYIMQVWKNGLFHTGWSYEGVSAHYRAVNLQDILFHLTDTQRPTGVVQKGACWSILHSTYSAENQKSWKL